MWHGRHIGPFPGPGPAAPPPLVGSLGPVGMCPPPPGRSWPALRKPHPLPGPMPGRYNPHNPHPPGPGPGRLGSSPPRPGRSPGRPGLPAPPGYSPPPRHDTWGLWQTAALRLTPYSLPTPATTGFSPPRGSIASDIRTPDSRTHRIGTAPPPPAGPAPGRSARGSGIGRRSDRYARLVRIPIATSVRSHRGGPMPPRSHRGPARRCWRQAIRPRPRPGRPAPWLPRWRPGPPEHLPPSGRRRPPGPGPGPDQRYRRRIPPPGAPPVPPALHRPSRTAARRWPGADPR